MKNFRQFLCRLAKKKKINVSPISDIDVYRFEKIYCKHNMKFMREPFVVFKALCFIDWKIDRVVL